ncbi:MAG: adenylosuccinate lyase [Bacteriovoracaceae bacterium]|nr:adenylosuccinate lyase [Bacteriovoracaceae bacterium]
MIPRYEISVISDIWSANSKYNYFLKVEKSLTKNLENHGIIKPGLYALLNDVKVNENRVDVLDKLLKHDVIAFTTSISEQIDSHLSKYFHYGVTSSDIVDTATMLQIKDSVSIVMNDLKDVLVKLIHQADISCDILTLGRSHGIYAEPMIFAHKWLSFISEFKRRQVELEQIIYTGQISGAVGNYSVITPKLEEDIVKDLGLELEPISTQIIPRDRYAKIAQIFSLLSTSIERIALELRHLHHSDVDEVHEGFSKNQKGSSTMPHKKNPISSENLTGICRMIRSFESIALDNTQSWHERDISHSSNERMYLPDMFGLTSYALRRLSSTLEGLSYNKEKIEKKVLDNPKVFSSMILHTLIDHTDYTREELYRIVQKACFENDSLEKIAASIQGDTGFCLKDFNFESIKSKYKETYNKLYNRIL